MTNRHHHCTFISLAAAAVCTAPPTWAQSTQPAIELTRIEVTARKRSEPLQEVPVAARTFSAEALADENVIDLKSLAARTASASTVELGAGFASEVVVRGAGVGRAVNAETATGLYRNGTYAAGGNIGGRSFNPMDFFDVQRIEVLRGPQGALFGRGAVGGAMHVLNVRPQSVASRSVNVLAGEYDRYGIEAIINQPLGESLALRAGIKSNTKRGGAVRQAGTGEPLDDERFDGARLSLSTRHGIGEYHLLVDGFSEAGPSFGVQQYVIAQPEARFVRNFNTPARFGRDEWTGIFEGNWDLGPVTLVAITQLKRRDASTYDDFDRFNNSTSPNLQSWVRYSEDSLKRIGQEVRVQGPLDSAWQWLAGVEWLRLQDDYLVDLSGAVAAARPNNSANLTNSRDRSVGVFGLLGYDFNPKLNLTLELRHQRDDKRFTLSSTTNTFRIGTTPAQQATVPVNTNTVVQDYKRGFEGVAKVLAGTYKHSKQVISYLRYGEAFRPGGFNNDPDRNTATSTPPGPRFEIGYEQERARSWELGIKTEALERRLRANLAAYWTRMDNILLNNNVSSTPPGSSTSRVIQFVENGGDARIDGVELDVSLEVPAPGPAGKLLVEGSANLTNTLINSGRFGGKDVPQTRPKSGSLGLTYQFQLPGTQRAFFNINTQQLAGGFQDPANLIPMDRVQQVNLNAGVRGPWWEVRLNASNITDELYITNYNNAQRTTGYTNLPSSWSLTLAARF
jgi:iron complex outermembrane receptor protein